MLQTKPPVVGRVEAADRRADGSQDRSSHELRQAISHQRGGGSRCHQQRSSGPRQPFERPPDPPERPRHGGCADEAAPRGSPVGTRPDQCGVGMRALAPAAPLRPAGRCSDGGLSAARLPPCRSPGVVAASGGCPVGDATGAGGLRSYQPGVQSTPQLATRKFGEWTPVLLLLSGSLREWIAHR